MEKGRTLTKEHIKAAKEAIGSQSERFDTYFITEDGELYGAKKLNSSPQKVYEDLSDRTAPK